mmetsp:Transcript_24779/g.51431  ORF Transcript_24779/g.51431 Transcript_24779/m.51431 type:complete len:233 (-) Transcript_24779:109-807(-)
MTFLRLVAGSFGVCIGLLCLEASAITSWHHPTFICQTAQRQRGRQPSSALNIFSENARDAKSGTTTTGVLDEEPNTSKNSTGTWNPFSLAVLRLGFTEPAFTSPLNYNKSAGIYKCAYCRTPLFSSKAKYDSGSGWPSFWRTIAINRVSLKREWDGRIECLCASCGGHLGHVFPDGPTRGSLDEKELENVPETDPKIGYKVKSSNEENGESEFMRMPRFCVNGVALSFEACE